MTRSTLLSGIGSVAFGVACIIAAIISDFKFESLLWGLGGAGIWHGISTAYSYMYWSKPDRRDEYNEKLRLERIEKTDERKIMLRDKSGRIMFAVIVVIHFSLMMISYHYSTNGLFLPFSLLSFFALIFLLVFQLVGVTLIYNHLNKKL